MRAILLAVPLLLATISSGTACNGESAGDGDADGDGTGGGLGDGDGDGTGGSFGDGDGDSSPDRICDPGATMICSAVRDNELCSGVQTCESDGAGWDDCICPSAGTGGAGMGGSSGSGGDGMGGSHDPPPEAVCEDVEACGGSVVGTWDVTSSCLEVDGPLLDLTSLGIGCAEGTITGFLNITGAFSVSEQGVYVDQTVTTGQVELELGPDCREVNGTEISCAGVSGPLASAGITGAQCSDNASTQGCSCGVVSFVQEGGLGHLSSAYRASGLAQVVDDILTLSSDEDFSYALCAEPSYLVLSPIEDAAGGFTGQVVLARRQ